MVEERPQPLGDDDLAALGPHRRFEPDHRREPHVGVAGGQHDLAGADLAVRRREPELAAFLGDALDAMARQVGRRRARLIAVCSVRNRRSEFTWPSSGQ